MNIVLSKEYEFEKVKVSEVEINIDDLSANQLNKLVKQYVKYANINNPVHISLAVLTFNDDFCIYVASSLSDKPMEFFESLSVKDYLKVLNGIQSFFVA